MKKQIYNSFSQKDKRCFSFGFIRKTMLLSLLLFFACIASAQLRADATDDSKLIDDFIRSKGYGSTIVFDASNIKQFWIDHSVFGKNELINILLTGTNGRSYDSVPLKIQLANVNFWQDCSVDVISKEDDLKFNVYGNNSDVIATSTNQEKFVQYNIYSTTFHLDETDGFGFSLKFSSNSKDSLSIKKIILHFSDNKLSPYWNISNTLKMTRDTVSITGTVSENKEQLEITGKGNKVLSKNEIVVNDSTILTTVRIKNTGNIPTNIYIGYKVLSKEKVRLDSRNYPLNNINKILTVISSEEGSDKIIVDSVTKWGKNCYLAINAKDDLSDIPNNTFVNGKIVEVKELSNGQAEITMDKPLEKALEKGTKVRSHGVSGSELYTNRKELQPGEEKVFFSTIKRDDSFLQYSPKAFSRGVYSVVPLIYSISSKEDNTVQISDYTIMY